MRNGCGFEAADPGLRTVICAVGRSAVVARSVAAIDTVSCVALLTTVARAVPFQNAVAPLSKPSPVTVTTMAALPAGADAGVRLVIGGTNGSTVTVKLPVAVKLAGFSG